MKEKLSVVWSYVKKWAGIVLLVAGAIVAFFLFRKQSATFADKFKELDDLHKSEIQKIQDARAEEQRQHDENVKKLQDTLDLVQKHYDDAKKELDDQKKKEIETLVKSYGDKPEELAKKLSELTGFSIIYHD